MGFLERLTRGFRSDTNADETSSRADGWESILNSLGKHGRDNTVSTSFKRSVCLDRLVLDGLYAENAIAARIIDQPIDDATREGFEVLIDNDDANAGETIVQASHRVRVSDGTIAGGEGCLWAANQAQKLADLYGGAVVIGLFADANPRLPLPPNAKLDRLLVLDRHAVTVEWVDGFVAGYRINTVHEGSNQGTIYHPSRVIPLCGAPRLGDSLGLDAGHGWGDSRLTRVYNTIRNAGATEQTAAHLAQRAVMGAYQIKHLAELIQANDIDAVRKWMSIQDAVRSAFNAILLGDGESYTMHSVDFNGLAKLLDLQPQRVSAAAGIPMMLLYGMSAPGLNATGEVDLRGYYDRVVAQYQGETGKLTRVMRCLLGWVVRDIPNAPSDYTLAWNPLWQLSALDEAALRKTDAERVKIEIEAGVLTPTEGRSRYTGREYTSEITLEEGIPERAPTPDPGEPFDAAS